MARNHDLESIVEGPDHAERLEEGIRNKTAVFLCIQTQSAAAWGLMHRLMAQLGKLGLEVIDHRAWSPRGVTTTLINEIYVKDKIEIAKGDSKQKLAARIEEITGKLEETINQPETSKVKVQRWYPGVIEEYTEAMDDSDSGETKLNLEERLLEAATAELERKQALQTNATQSVRTRKCFQMEFLETLIICTDLTFSVLCCFFFYISHLSENGRRNFVGDGQIDSASTSRRPGWWY